MKIWDATRDQEFVKFDFRIGQPNSDWNRSVKFSPDSRLLAIGSAGMQLFEASGGVIGPKSLGLGVPYCIDFSADGTRIAAGGRSFVKVWSVSDGAEIASIPSGPGNPYVYCVGFSPDGNRLAWTSQKVVNVVEIKTGALLQTYDRHEEIVHWVAFAPDGRDIASLSDDGIVRMWNAETGADRFSRLSPLPKDAFKLTNGTGNNLCFSPQGYLAVGGGVMNKQGVIELWDAATGETLGTMKGHSSIVTAIAFNGEGTRMVTGALDGSLKVWDPLRKDELFTLHDEAGIISVAFSSDGKRIASGGIGRVVKLWDTTPP